MCGMVWGIDDKLYRLRSDGFYFFHQTIEVLIAGILRVDDNQPLIRHPHECVCAAAGDFVEIRLQHFDLLNGLSGCRTTTAGAALSKSRNGYEANQQCNTYEISSE